MVTYSMQWPAVVVLAAGLFAWWYFGGRRRVAWAFLFGLSGSAAVDALVKLAVHRARPPLSQAGLVVSGYSWPSGHTTAAAFLAMFLAALAWRARHRWWRYSAPVLALGWPLLIGYSRLYFGVHWASDILGGLLLGYAGGAAAVAWWWAEDRGWPAERRRGGRQAGLVLLAGTMIFLFAYARLHPVGRVVVPPSARIAPNFVSMGDNIFSGVPRVSEGLGGAPQEPVNIIAVGSSDALASAMHLAGWVKADALSWGSSGQMAAAVVDGAAYPAAPGVWAYWDAQPNDFAYERQEGSVKRRYHVHWWQTAMRTDGGQVWFGTVHFDCGWRRTGVGMVHGIDPAIDQARDQLSGDLLGSGMVTKDEDLQVTGPLDGHNQAGDAFYTDGTAKVLWLKGGL